MLDTSGGKVYPIDRLLPVPNVCDQVLREVFTMPGVSMAHVAMEPGNVSLLHSHHAMSEIYYFLSGSGMLEHGEHATQVQPGAYVVIDKNIPHRLRNSRDSVLEHLVFAIPPFDPADVHLVEMYPSRLTVNAFTATSPTITAQDGALIHELLTPSQQTSFGISLATGQLPAGRSAISHHHKKCFEAYVVLGGSGYVLLDGTRHSVRAGYVALIPPLVEHALENASHVQSLDVLCVCSPAFDASDFLLK